MNATSDTLGDTLLDLIHEYGAPEKLTMDGAESQIGRHTKYQALLRKYDIPFHISSPQRPNKNRTESNIRGIKTRWYMVMHKKKFLKDYGIFSLCVSVKLETYAHQVQNMLKAEHN